jgi:hypothetical protein
VSCHLAVCVIFRQCWRLRLQHFKATQIIFPNHDGPTNLLTEELVKHTHTDVLDEFNLVSVPEGAGMAQSVKRLAERPRGRSSSPGRVKNFLFSTLSRPPLESTQTPIPGRAIVQAVNRRLPSHVGFCDGQKWRWGRFSPRRTSVSPANLHSIFGTRGFGLGLHGRNQVPFCLWYTGKKKKI